MTVSVLNDNTPEIVTMSGEQDYTAYVDGGARFTINNGITYTLATPIVSNGTFQIGNSVSTTAPDTTFVMNVGSVSASSVKFDNAHGTLVLGINSLATIDIQTTDTAPATLEANPNFGVPLIGAFDCVIQNFQRGDTIEVDTTVPATFIEVSLTSTIVDVVETANTLHVLGTLAFNNSASANSAVSNPSYLQNNVVTACFLSGTEISTLRGPVPVEALAVGDQAVLARGGAARIIWIGRRFIDAYRHPKPETMWPVCVAADAFGPGQPVRELKLSPDHAIYSHGVLVPVQALVNGTSIVQRRQDQISYFHVELEQHDAILAEALPVESFLENLSRSDFDGEDSLMLHPLFLRGTGPFAPIHVQGEVVEQIRTELAQAWAKRQAEAQPDTAGFVLSPRAAG